MAKRSKSIRRKSSGFPMEHDVYGYVAVGIVFVVLFILLSGLKNML